MLHGILSRKWRDVIAEQTKERVQCKASHMVKVIWKKMFMPMWNQRNKIIHTEDSIAVTREHEMLDKTLDRFILNFRELLHHMQYNLSEYTEEQTEHWGINAKREMVNILIAVRLSYASMLWKGDGKKSLIADFWN